MTDVLLVLILLVEAAGLCLRFLEPKGKKESEPTDPAPVAAAVPEGTAEKPTRGQKDFDEGFQNIMRYAVRGSTGFEERE